MNGTKSGKAYKLNFFSLFWIFFIASILGFILETVWCYATLGRIESRKGLIYGPFSQIYGFGAIFLALCFQKISKRRDILIFLGCAVLGGAFEYLCSLIQQFFFGTVSWEYSNTQFNIQGRTNLMFSFMWGLLGVFWIKDILPRIIRTVEKLMSHRPARFITWVCIVFISADCIISLLAVVRQTQRAENIGATGAVQVFLDKHYPSDYMKKIYPNMRYVKKPDK